MTGAGGHADSAARRRRVEQLSNAVFDGEATDAERAELARLLDEDPRAARRFEHTRAVVQRLQAPVEAPDLSAPILAEAAGRGAFRSRSRLPGATAMVLAASLLLTIGVVMLLGPLNEPDSPPQREGGASPAPDGRIAGTSPDGETGEQAAPDTPPPSPLSLGADARRYEGDVTFERPDPASLERAQRALGRLGGSGTSAEIRGHLELGATPGGVTPLAITAARSASTSGWSPDSWRAALRISAAAPIKPGQPRLRWSLVDPDTGEPSQTRPRD